MPYQPDPDLRAFIQSLPKTETHIHLEGSMPLELCRRVDPVAFAQPPPYWADNFRFDGFAEFQEQFDRYFFKWYVSPEAYHESCRTIFRNLVEQNCVYLECSFHLGTAERTRASMRDIARAIHAACPPELELRLFLGMFRDHYHGALAEIIEQAITWDEIAGVDLHGFENPVFQPLVGGCVGAGAGQRQNPQGACGRVFRPGRRAPRGGRSRRAPGAAWACPRWMILPRWTSCAHT